MRNIILNHNLHGRRKARYYRHCYRPFIAGGVDWRRVLNVSGKAFFILILVMFCIYCLFN